MRKFMLLAAVVLFTLNSPVPAQPISAAARSEAERVAAQEKALKSLRDATFELTAKKHKIQLKIGENEVQLAEIRTRLSLNSGGLGTIGLMQIELYQLGDARFQLDRIASRARDRYESLTKRINDGQVPGQVEEYLDKHPRLAALRARLDSFEEETQQLTPKTGEKNDGVIKAQTQRDALAKRLAETENQLRTKAVARLVDEARQSMEDSARDSKEMSERLQAMKINMGDLATEMDEYVVKENESNGLREEVKHINDRLDQIEADWRSKLPN